MAAPTGSLNDRLYWASLDKALRAALNAGGEIQYLAMARAGILPDAAKWQIRKLTYDSTYTSQVVKIEFADGDDAFDNVWEATPGDQAYAALSYS